MSYIPFGQDKAVIKTGNASIQVIHIVWDYISKLRSNVLCWCLHMMLYLHLLQYQISFIIVIIMFLHVKIKKGKFIKNLPTFAKLVYLFVLFVLVIILFLFLRGEGWVSVVVWLLDFHYLCNQCLSPLKL